MRFSGGVNMARAHFERLQVYPLAEKLADEIWAVVVGWDRFPRQTGGTQITRAADSIGANLAEGTGRGSFQDNRRFVRTARASWNETRHGLRRAHKRRLLTTEAIGKLKPRIDELAPRLNAYLQSIGNLSERRNIASEEHGLGETATDN